jgi:WD40 repeat protein
MSVRGLWTGWAVLLAIALPVRAGDEHARSKPGILWSQSSALTFAVFNHRGDRLAGGACHGEVRLWNPRDWSLVARIDVEGSLSYLCFSPDDRFLYVADGAVNVGTLARYDVRTGKRVRTYAGHRGVAKWIVVSPDGETLVTYGTFDRRTVFWDARTGKILRQHRRRRCHTLPSPDGRGLLFLDPESGWMLEPFRGERPEPFALPGFPRPADMATVVSSGDGRWLVVSNENADYPYYSNPGSLTLYERRGGTYRRVARIEDGSPWPFSELALSPDHRLIAAGGERNRIRFYSVPTLARIADVRFPSRGDHSLTTLAISPDARLLALGVRAPVPGLVDLTTFERAMPWTGHGDEVTALFFTADGRHLRSLGRDNVLCIWDAATMRRVARRRLPDGHEVVSARPPHGDRLLTVREDSADAVVVDGTSGKVLHEFTLPAGYERNTVHWLSADRVLLVGEDRDRLGWFDCAQGRLTREVGIERLERSGTVTEDFRHLYALIPPFRYQEVLEAVRIDLETGAGTRLRPPEPVTTPARSYGLVPGGRYFYLADPDVRIHDRASLACVALHRFEGREVRNVTPSGNGERFAVVVRDGPRCRIQVHETLSGRRIGAIPTTSLYGRVALDDTGARIAFVNADATIERWTLPAASK